MTGTIRVLPIPSAHRYVAHLATPDPMPGGGRGARGPQVQVLPDPPVAGAPRGVWWPAPALRPDWVEEHHQRIDVVHAHFGFESRTPQQLAQWVRSLRAHGLPLVLTVHDLTNPHERDQRQHGERLDVLVSGADALVTLTRGAALEVRRRWGRAVHVVPHPHMAPLHLVGVSKPDRAGGPARIGVHLKSLRANVDALGLLPVLARACRSVPATQLVVHVHEEALHPGFIRYDPQVVRLLDTLEQSGAAQVHRIDPMDDEALWHYLRGLDASVLPYRWGTHSGWLEECRDLGTPVLAPDVGYYTEQGPVLSYRRHGASVDPVSVLAAVRRIAAGDVGPAARPQSRVGRVAGRRHIAYVHSRIYDQVLRGSLRSPEEEAS